MRLPWWSSGEDCAFSARDVGSVPGQGTKITHTAQPGKTNKNKQRRFYH